MGTCDSINERENSNEEYINIRAINGSSNLNQNQRRSRLLSDPTSDYTYLQRLQPLRRHSNYERENNSNISNNQIHLRLSGNCLNQNNIRNNDNGNNYLSQRKFSDSYCNAFRQSYMSSGQNGLLRHLTETLDRVQEISETDFEEIKSKYIPKYIIDWRLEIDPITKKKRWINYGKINLSDEKTKKEIGDKINKTKYINSNEMFYIKRLWLMQYLYKNYGLQNKENPVLIINRQNILEDSFRQFATTKEFNISRPIKIFFIDEVASDEGGVYRDWYTCLFKSIFSKEKKLFKENNNNCLEKNTYMFYPKYKGMKLEYYEFIGKLFTKALVDMMNIINYQINLTIIKQFLKKDINLEDMQYYDMDLYKSLLFIKNEKNIENNEELKDMRFTWIIRDENNNRKEVELIPNGRNIKLNENNKNIFIEKVIYQEITRPYEEQINYFRKGLLIMLDDEVRNIFSIDEFKFILSGQAEINIKDWKENTIYKGDFNEQHPVIKMFWECIEALNKTQLEKFIEFVTGCSSIPLDGFGNLKGMGGNIMKFTIEPYICFSAEDPYTSEFRLIEAKTCFNRIILPYYKNKYEMNKAINIILNNDTSFFGLE